jgi:hypothetical protein
MVQSSQGINKRPFVRNTQKAKRARGVVQVVECLPIKCKALSSNSSIIKKEKKRKWLK